MNNFVVSARKYRPRLFSDIKGQDHIIKTIQNAIKTGQIASAFLFCGLLGSGKTSLARILAKALNCDNNLNGEPCGTCSSCTQRASLNIHELDAASHNSAEDMRRIVEQIRYCPPNGKKMVIIIDESHMLSNAALNVLLKPLEDTPPHVVFILVTTEKYKIIPTILSRCQVFDFHAIAKPAIEQQIKNIAQKENITCEKEALDLIIEKANGSLRNALSMFDLVVTFAGNKALTYSATLRHLNLLDDTVYFSITEAIYQGNITDILIQYDSILRTGFDGFFFVIGLAQHLRNVLVAKTTETLSILQVPTKYEKRYQQSANQLPTFFIYEALDIIQTCELNYKTSADHRLYVEMTLIKMGRINNQESLAGTTHEKTTTPASPSQQAIPKSATAQPLNHQPVQAAATTPPTSSQQASPTSTTAQPLNHQPVQAAATTPPNSSQQASPTSVRAQPLNHQPVQAAATTPPTSSQQASPKSTTAQPLNHQPVQAAATTPPASSQQASPKSATAQPLNHQPIQATTSNTLVSSQKTQTPSLALSDTNTTFEPSPTKLTVSNKKRTIVIPTVEEIKRKIAQQQLEKQKEVTITPQQQSNPLSIQNILQHWKAYAQALKHTHPAEYAALQLPITLENNTIVVRINNQQQQTAIQRLQPNVLAYLQKKIPAQKLAIQCKVQPQQQKIPYSDQQKLQNLLQDHTPLTYLQGQLGLAT